MLTLKNKWIAGKDFTKQNYHIKKDFHSKLNLEGITDENYMHAQNVWKVFNIKNFCEYPDLYI